MHKGVDFAAPSGTPIKAAGDGVISKAGWNGGYGRYVRIKHDKTYQTAYAHLRRIAKGIKPGKRVKQGQVIGYVGSSGRSTGPHLHYEILKNAKQVNPRSVRFQSAEALGGNELKRFKRFRDKIDRSLNTSGKPDLVAQTQR
jgi:murein DD-endopeptidase MepM/ murein hydrolase activator NlpD